MGALKIDHSDPARHRASIMQQMRHFWMDDHLCDVVLKSYDGAEHHAHMAVLSAASVFFKNLLGGPFLEAQRVQQKQPVEIAASKEALCALLDYIYDGQPEVPVEVGLELLRLADAFDMPKLAGEIAACIHAHLDCSVALQVLQDPYVLHSLSAASEDKVIEEFEICSQHPYLGKLSASQLTRILTREDLSISREETVMNAILTWNKFSEDGHAFGTLLQHVHFQALSIENLLHLRVTTLSGPNGDDLHKRVEDALSSRKRIRCPGGFEPKRPCLRHWSPFLGASTTSIEGSGRVILSLPCTSLCWHQGKLFAASFSSKSSILCWKPGDPASCVRPVAGEGATVTGINDLGFCGRLSISPSSEIFVADWWNQRIVCFEHGSGHFVVDVDASALCCSPNGGLYVLSRAGRTLQKWVGSQLQTVLTSESLRADLQFSAGRMFVTKKEVIYLLDNRIEPAENKRILCFNPAESLKPVVVGRAPTEGPIFLSDLFVTESGIIYVVEWHQRKLLAFHPGSTTYAEVLRCPRGLHPVALLLQDRSLYVSMVEETSGEDSNRPGAVYQYLLPPDLQLE